MHCVRAVIFHSARRQRSSPITTPPQPAVHFPTHHRPFRASFGCHSLDRVSVCLDAQPRSASPEMRLREVRPALAARRETGLRSRATAPPASTRKPIFGSATASPARPGKGPPYNIASRVAFRLWTGDETAFTGNAQQRGKSACANHRTDITEFRQPKPKRARPHLGNDELLLAEPCSLAGNADKPEAVRPGAGGVFVSRHR